MRGAGLGMMLGHMRRRKPTRKCERCGLRHAIDLPACPHCNHLSDSELAAFRQELKRQARAHTRLGGLMLLAALLLTGLLWLINL